MKKIVSLKHPIYIGDDCLLLLKKKTSKYSKINVLVDENTNKYCLPLLKRHIQHPHIIKIKSGETNKTLSTCEKIWSVLSAQNADRNSLLINLGGGVITDLGGFAAATYKRGIDCINIPTTLLAQVDASVGGKTGVDFNNYKNQIGTFSFPTCVYINPVFLNTLSKRQLLSGFAEMIKHALITDKKYWNLIKKNIIKFNITEALISHSIQLKNKIVSADPTEKKDRKKLNYGHTIGHAIESAMLHTAKPLLHGEAIAIGMICESYISRKTNGLSSKNLLEITDVIKKLYGIQPIKCSFAKLSGFLYQDKKNNGAEINFTLLNGIGKSTIDKTCNMEVIKESIDYYNWLYK